MKQHHNKDVEFQKGEIDEYRVTFIGNPPAGFSQSPRDIEFLRYFQANRERSLFIVPQLAALVDADLPFKEAVVLNLPVFSDHQEGVIFTAYFMCLLAENYRMMRNGNRSYTKYKVKLLAFYQVMFEGFSPQQAVAYPRRQDVPYQTILTEHRRLFDLHALYINQHRERLTGN
ncbi:hypothetical protein [Deinococcus ruber]|uniref:Uncharacterized protein n=1 Tax=Deinococcus ruber TaxID=1848197 RepID=A0A918F5Y1_9DEIO|nr:hypothetical protein [Deinococcus ruber]GGR11203.1 hypothetical protein GCM10008957_24860 [Deinococcus ruber]